MLIQYVRISLSYKDGTPRSEALATKVESAFILDTQGGGGKAPHGPRPSRAFLNRHAFPTVLIIPHCCQKSKYLDCLTIMRYNMDSGKDASNLSRETGRGPRTAYISGICAIGICRDGSAPRSRGIYIGTPRVEGRRAACFSSQVELHLNTLHSGGEAGSCVILEGVAPLLIASHNRNRFMAGLIHNAAFTRAGLQRRRDEAGAQRVRAEV